MDMETAIGPATVMEAVTIMKMATAMEAVTVTQILPAPRQKEPIVLTMKLSTKPKKAAKIIVKSTKQPTITAKDIL
jgi:hypothetical protein